MKPDTVDVSVVVPVFKSIEDSEFTGRVRSVTVSIRK